MPDMEIRNFAYHANISFNLRGDDPKFGSLTTKDTKSLNDRFLKFDLAAVQMIHSAHYFQFACFFQRA